jgi:glyoxylase-like metal-dependent hydrolase (beta-lactamase superfamily II)
MWGWPDPSRGMPVDDGDTVFTEHHAFQVLHTPGHAADHICLYEPAQGWLFTGDLYVGGKDRALRAGYDIWQIIASLERVAALEITTMFPGSARIPDEPQCALADKIAHLEGLGEQVLTLRDKGASVSEIVRRLCGRPMPIELLTLGHFSRRNLVRSYLGSNQ